MADVTDYKIYKNTQFEVLTDQGFKDFKGVIKGKNKSKIKITLDTSEHITCTPKHKLVQEHVDNWMYAEDISIGDVLHGDKIVSDVMTYQDDAPVFELLHVEQNHRYIVNGVLSKQCLVLDELAFIDNHLVESFWKSVYPIISSSKKSKIFIASTPNGTGNLFHDIYSNAVKGKNNWCASRIDWWEIPGRDDKWKQDTINSLGSKDIFDQEFGCQFIETGESVLDEELSRRSSLTISESKHVFEDGHYHVWELPDENRTYTIGVDISEGVGDAASVVQVLDITDVTEIDQVAVYHNNTISPYNFTTKLLEILQQWGNPPALIERNNCGAQVVDTLVNVHGYENIVNYTPGKNQPVTRPGVIAHTNTKYKGVMNMKYWLSEVYAVNIRDAHTLEELKTFVRYPNGTWKAIKGTNVHDDRVMSLIWALMILENTITEQFYEIEQVDKNNKPAVIRRLDYGLRQFSNTLNLYADERNSSFDAPPIYIDSETLDQSESTMFDHEVADLEQQGWTFL